MAGLSWRKRLGLKKAAQLKNLVIRRDYYRRTAMEIEAANLPVLTKQAAIRKLESDLTATENKIEKLTARADHPGFNGLGERSYYAPKPDYDPLNLPGLSHLAEEPTAEDEATGQPENGAEVLNDMEKAAFKRVAIVGGSLIAALALLR